VYTYPHLGGAMEVVGALREMGEGSGDPLPRRTVSGERGLLHIHGAEEGESESVAA